MALGVMLKLLLGGLVVSLLLQGATAAEGGCTGGPLIIAIVNGGFNLAAIILTSYLIQITSRLDRRYRVGGE